MTNEIEELRRQIKQSKSISDNAMHENRRLTNELADMECKKSLIKIKLDESEKEVDKVKKQLQQYVQEVQRAEDLLLKKVWPTLKFSHLMEKNHLLCIFAFDAGRGTE